jgi:hypothetical protein
MNKKLTRFKPVWLFIGAVIISTALAIVPNQFDNFEDGTLQDWGSGLPNPAPPVNVTTGGPAGANDNFLRVSAVGGAGAGSKLVIFNSTQWTGNYITAGVQFVSMYIKNFTDTLISLRIALRGPGGDFWSINPVIIAGLSNWQPIVFSVQPASLTGGTDVNTTLGGVTQVRILHSVAGGFAGNAIAAQIGIDNITAASQPVPVELTSFTAQTQAQSVILNWVTATELNNHGFEIQRKVIDGDFAKVGFVKGEGTTTNQKEYLYVDKNLIDGKYFYRLKQLDFGGIYDYSQTIEVNVRTLDNFILEQNYPNPFNPSTKIKFNIPLTEKVRFEVFNTVGNKVATLLNELKEAGSYEVQFEADNLASGVYFYKISAGNFVQTKKMLLIR